MVKKKKNHLFFWQNASFSKVGLDSERFEPVQRCLLGAAEARIQGTVMTNRGAIFLVPPVGWTLGSVNSFNPPHSDLLQWVA